VFFTSCSSSRPKGATEAEVLLKEADELVKAERYLLALDKLGQLRTEHPYSFHNTAAELMQADILFSQESYTEAAASYITFKDFHPKHAKVDYVTWMIAESFFHQIPPTYDRDLSVSYEAIKYYEDLIRSYPQSSYVQKSRNRIALCEELLRLKEEYIADFYYRTDRFSSARERYRSLIERYRGLERSDLSPLTYKEEVEEEENEEGKKELHKKLLEDQMKRDLIVSKLWVQRVLNSSIKLKEGEKCLQDIDLVEELREKFKDKDFIEKTRKTCQELAILEKEQMEKEKLEEAKKSSY